MNKHTHGKWEYDTTSNYYQGSGVIRMNGVLIAAMVTQTTHKDGEVEANAHLIAAAPEMLNILELIINGYDKDRTVLQRDIMTAKHVVAKAGEPC